MTAGSGRGLTIAPKRRTCGRRRWPCTAPTERGRWSYDAHVVNNAMALKQGALWWRLTGAEPDRVAACAMMDALDRHHGMATGVFSGDECLAGTNPSQGTELCAVAEYLYSLQWLLGLQGDPALADRLERIAFNAVPATFSPDMWAHQYDQQVNQVECSVREERLWNTNGPDANIFGLEPHYGCCTANLSQAWPKFAAHLWMRPRGNGIAAVAYAPSALATEIDGVPVNVDRLAGVVPRGTAGHRHGRRFPRPRVDRPQRLGRPAAGASPRRRPCRGPDPDPLRLQQPAHRRVPPPGPLTHDRRVHSIYVVAARGAYR